MVASLELGLDKESARRILEIANEVGAFLRGNFTLTSGRKSSYYFDGRKMTLSPEGAYWVGKAIFDELVGLDVEAIGGLAIGAVPIVSEVALISYLEGRQIDAFIVREVAKEHGTKRKVEGHLRQGSRVAIVDDVITTGGSVNKAIEAAEMENCKVVKVIVITDRHEGGSDRLKAAGYDLTAILHIRP
jgi:orotate phosphoribosyltransferase